MTHAVVYARFSTELQNEKSTEDQIELCRAYAARQDFDVIGTYEDKARSGASVFGRDGLMRLMDAARDRKFGVVIVEALDRLSRDMEDLAGIHKRLSFLSVEIHAVHDGTADAVLVGLRGLVGQLQREDGAKKVRRGMAGVIRDGRHAGGRAYGFRSAPGRIGELEILKEEAEVVRRIFSAYADGRPPREIAGELNREGVAPPRGAKWNASTINGNAQRGNGLIFNELYAGRIVWNKVRMVKNPDTGKRISRPNPRDQWQTISTPQLRIVDDETWARVQALKAEEAERELSSLEEVPQIITLHPATIESYIATVDRLAGGLSEHATAEDDRGSLVANFRALVHSVTVHPNAPREGFQVEVKGKLASLIGGEAFPQAKYSGGRMVAEVRYRRSPRPISQVFSLSLHCRAQTGLSRRRVGAAS